MKAELHSLRWAALFALALVLGAMGSSRADDVSAWDADSRSAIRLIAGTISNSGAAAPLRAGIELRLDSGWKTYWRYAGDSGLPPKFDFNDSENVKSATVLWPAPRRFPDGAGGNSIGYPGNVIFPVHIVAEDPAKPVLLRVKASYGVCEKICVPAAGKVELMLTSGPASEEASLAAAEARVPKPVALGAGGTLTIRGAHREVVRPGQARVIVDVTAPAGMNIDLFAEGPAPQWSLPLPEPVDNGPDGVRRFAFAVDGVPPGSRIEGALLKLTLVAEGEAIEVTTHLD